MGRKAGLLLLAGLAFSLYFKFTGQSLALFFAACVSIIPLAGLMGQATENLACYTGEKVGGLINATFGNATELLITLFAVRAGMFDVVKASIAGSILGNILLVLGLAMFAGGLKNGEQHFDAIHAGNQTNLLFLAVIALVVPAVFFNAAGQPRVLEEFSLAVAVLLLIVYVAGLIFAMGQPQAVCENTAATWSKKLSIGVLLFSTLLIALESEFLVSSIESVTESLHWSPFFIGIVLVPIIGNAAEHATAVRMALKNKMELAFEIAAGSSAQIALFVTPVLVFVSLALGREMNLIFNFYELAAIGLAVLIARFTSEDGRSNWLEGAMLLAAYGIIAIAFFLI